MAGTSFIFFVITALFAQGNGLTITNGTATVKQIMTIKSEGVEGEDVNVVVHSGTLGAKEASSGGRPNFAAEITKLKRQMGVSNEGMPQVQTQESVDDAAASSNKVAVTRSEPEPVEDAANKSSSWTFSLLLMAVAFVVALRTPQGQAVAAQLGLLKSQESWSKMSVDGKQGIVERFLDSPLVTEALAVLGFGGESPHVQEMQSKPQNVKLVASAVKQTGGAVQWVKPPEPVGNLVPKKREDFEGFPQEPLMSVSANQTFSALADMLESAGESEIAGKLRSNAAPAGPDSEVQAMDDMGLTMSQDDAMESPEVAALRAALAEDEPPEPEVVDHVVSNDETSTVHVQKSLIDTSAESDVEL